MSFEWINLFQFSFVALALILAGLTLGTGQTRWLGAFFLAIGLHGALSRLPFAADTVLDQYSFAIAFAYGPLIYLALRNLLRLEPVRLFKLLLVIVPVVVAFILIASGAASLRGLGILLTLVQLLSVYAGFRELRRYNAVYEQTQSSSVAPSIRWVGSALGFYLGMVVVLATRSVVAAIAPEQMMSTLDLLVSVGIATTLATLTFKILSNPGWIPRVSGPDRQLTDDIAGRKAEITPERINLAAELNSYLDKERAFLDPELTVRKLAEQVGWSPRQLSEVINSVDSQTFSQKINSLRVGEAQKLMGSPDMLPMLDIAMRSGFNSKSAFNLMFKRITGVTPSQYRQKQSN
jgi:AraC-like DNA-binding protein